MAASRYSLQHLQWFCELQEFHTGGKFPLPRLPFLLQCRDKTLGITRICLRASSCKAGSAHALPRGLTAPGKSARGSACHGWGGSCWAGAFRNHSSPGCQHWSRRECLLSALLSAEILFSAFIFQADVPFLASCLWQLVSHQQVRPCVRDGEQGLLRKSPQDLK